MYLKEILDNCKEELCFELPVGNVVISRGKSLFITLNKKYKRVIKEKSGNFAAVCSREPQTAEDLEKIQVAFELLKKDIYMEMLKDISDMGVYDFDYDTLKKVADEHKIYWRFYAVLAALYDLNGIQRYSCSYRELYSEDVEHFRIMYGKSVEAYLDNSDISAALVHSFDDVEYEIAIYFLVFLEQLNKIQGNVGGIFGDGNEEERSRRLYSNVQQKIIPDDKLGDVIYEIINVNPMFPDLYSIMVEKYGDSSGNIQKISEFLGYENSVLQCKKKMAEEYLKKLPIETEEEAIQSKEKLFEYCDYLSLKGEEKEAVINKINERLEELDRLYRTVDGITFETREEADFAKEELPAIKEFMSYIKAPAADALLDYEQELIVKKNEFSIKFSSGLKEKYLKQIDRYLAQFDDNFCTVGLFKKLSRKEAGEERLLKLIKKCDVSTPENIEKAYAQMEGLLPRVGLLKEEAGKTLSWLSNCKDELALQFVRQNQGNTEEEAKQAKEKLLSYCEELKLEADENLKSIQYIDKILADFDLRYRTVDEIECETREEADLAREELGKIREFMGQLTPPDSESLLDYEEELLEKRKIFEEAFHSKIKGKYLMQINRYLEDFDKKFCSTGLFKKTDRKQAGKDRALKYVKKLDLSTPQKIEEAYILLEKFLPLVGINMEEAVEAVQYLDKKRDGKNILGNFGKIFKK